MLFNLFQRSQKASTFNLKSKPTLQSHTLMTTDRTDQVFEGNKQLNSENREDTSTLKRTQNKRVRLRDYLKMAKICSDRNIQRKRSLSKNKTQKEIKQSLAQIREQKYKISKNQIHKIVSDQISEEMQKMISYMSSVLTHINSSNHQDTTKQDLIYLYEIKKILRDKFRTGLKQIKQIQYMKHQNTLKALLGMHQQDAPENISQL